MLPFEMEVDESALASGTAVGADKNTLLLTSRTGAAVDEGELSERLRRLAGVARVTRLVVQPDSQAPSLSFIGALPGLEALQVYSLGLKSVDGLGEWSTGKYLEIDTGRNTKRDLQDVANARVDKIRLRCANAADLGAVTANRAMQVLELVGSPEIPMAALASGRLRDLSVYAGTAATFGDSAQVRSLRTLLFSGCRKLQTLTGDNGGITWLVIEKCPELDLATIRTFTGVEQLHLASLKQEIRLADFASLSALKGVSLRGCRVSGEVVNLKVSAPGLTELLLDGANRGSLEQWRAANPGVSVTNGRE